MPQADDHKCNTSVGTAPGVYPQVLVEPAVVD